MTSEKTVNDNFTRLIRYNTSGISCWLTLILVAFLLGSIGLGWVVNGFLILVALLIITPVLALVGLQWWLKRNLVQDQCPVCSYEFTGFNNTEFRCPNCSEPLKVEAGHFSRITPPGTIDVDAVDVSVQQIEEEK
ncbi:MAG: hypothetical protein QNJ34_22630 [Xenococcaceae cyanobacterium MO_188.B29]|nr:hypothetical protein [Xenococcaceae cyanobacterium MO_188.B29]